MLVLFPCTLQEMRASWKIVEEKFAPRTIFLDRGYQYILTHAIRSSNHPLVAGVTFLASQAAL